MKMVRLNLYNGSTTKEAWNPNSPEFVDDWKPEERVILCDSVQLTYGNHLKIYFSDGHVDDYPIDEDGFLVVDKVFYGDFLVEKERGEEQNVQLNTKLLKLRSFLEHIAIATGDEEDAGAFARDMARRALRLFETTDVGISNHTKE
jgi:hypothetical protein